MMGLVVAGLVLAVLTAVFVWRAADRLWHRFFIVLLGVALCPAVARWLTGDVSRFLPAGSFAEGADGKDQIVLASVLATILVSIVLAAGLWAAGASAWRQFQRKGTPPL